MTISLVSISALVAAIIANSFANILIKTAGNQGGEGIGLYLNPWFISGAMLFGINLVAYTLALKSIPLNIAYPVLIGSSLIVVSLVSAFVFKENFSLPHFAGCALILLGAALIVR